jgi:hypothetical protein
MDSDRNAKKDTHRARMARLAYTTALYSLNAAFSPNELLSVPLTLPFFALCISGLLRIRSIDVTIGAGSVVTKGLTAPSTLDNGVPAVAVRALDAALPFVNRSDLPKRARLPAGGGRA